MRLICIKSCMKIFPIAEKIVTLLHLLEIPLKTFKSLGAMESENKELKRYYTIKEVAQMINVNESTLRFWETEFPYLRPKTLGNKVRQYQEKDIEQIRLIHNLVKVRGFKLAAAQKIISQNRHGAEKSAEILQNLLSIREELKELKRSLDMFV